MVRAGVGLGVALAALALAAPAAATPYVHAHRGGPTASEGGAPVPAHPENTLPAFRAAARAGFTLEVDVRMTADRVPVVMHDTTLDRTTNCSGQVNRITSAALAECEVDLLGTDDVAEPLPPGDPRRAHVPTLAQVLELAIEEEAELNLEIKNVPVDPDFDITHDFARIVLGEIKRSGFPPSRLIVQSFWPLNLSMVEMDPYFKGATTSLLTQPELNAAGPAAADALGIDWVSPAWPVDQAYVTLAHALGLRVVPYTLNDPDEVKAASNAGVDAVITNDPHMARAALAAVAPPEPEIPPPPTDAECAATRASRQAPVIEAYRPAPGAPRVFAMQPKQELRHVRTYTDFRTKVECMIREHVVPRLAKGRPNVVAFNEDIGLMTMATGSRGALARNLFANPKLAPSCEPIGVPCGTLGALAAVRAGYAIPTVAYQTAFPTMPLLGGTFVAVTDTFARGWMQVFSDMAKRYGIYILGSNNQAPFRESTDPVEIALHADPDLPKPPSVYVATEPRAYNEVFMWGPEDVRVEGPPMLRNVVAQNRKVPVTPIEKLIEIAPGPDTGPDAIENVRPYELPGTEARISFATSLPAFVYGHTLGQEPPALDPCSNTAAHYMQCLDRLGTNLVIQDEANPGRWAAQSGEGNFQPLEWMRSTWRAVADPEVSFAYNVTPHMVGNLADLVFDGQSAITQRGLAGGERCTYVGNAEVRPEDPPYLHPYAGPKSEFIAVAPWVSPDAPRADLRETSRRLAAGSRDALENDYVETAIVADLPFPPDPQRPSCVTANDGGDDGDSEGDPLPPVACSKLIRGTRGPDRLRGTGANERIVGRGGNDRLAGRGGSDCLLGGAGNDRLRGGKGNDLLRGGPGRDRFNCGPGKDVAIAERGERVARNCEHVERR